MKKYEFYKRFQNCHDLRQEISQHLKNKYFNLWMNKFKINGLDEEIEEQQRNYFMRRLYSDGRIAIRYIQKLDMFVFAPFMEQEWNQYDYPEKVKLINKRNVPKTLIPSATQVVNRDVVLVYAQPNKKSIEAMVNYYIERLVNVEMVINTNLHLHKMPYLIGANDESKSQLEDIVDKILNDELVVFSSIDDLNSIKVLLTNAPYLIDKLKQYAVSLENQLLTYLGIDNSGHEKMAQMIVDEVNANNDIINDYGNAIEEEIKQGLKNVQRVFGREITIEATSKPVDTTKDIEMQSNPNNEGGEENE